MADAKFEKMTEWLTQDAAITATGLSGLPPRTTSLEPDNDFLI